MSVRIKVGADTSQANKEVKVFQKEIARDLEKMGLDVEKVLGEDFARAAQKGTKAAISETDKLAKKMQGLIRLDVAKGVFGAVTDTAERLGPILGDVNKEFAESAEHVEKLAIAGADFGEVFGPLGGLVGLGIGATIGLLTDGLRKEAEAAKQAKKDTEALARTLKEAAEGASDFSEKLEEIRSFGTFSESLGALKSEMKDARKELAKINKAFEKVNRRIEEQALEYLATHPKIKTLTEATAALKKESSSFRDELKKQSELERERSAQISKSIKDVTKLGDTTRLKLGQEATAAMNRMAESLRGLDAEERIAKQSTKELRDEVKKLREEAEGMISDTLTLSDRIREIPIFGDALAGSVTTFQEKFLGLNNSTEEFSKKLERIKTVEGELDKRQSESARNAKQRADEKQEQVVFLEDWYERQKKHRREQTKLEAKLHRQEIDNFVEEQEQIQEQIVWFEEFEKRRMEAAVKRAKAERAAHEAEARAFIEEQKRKLEATQEFARGLLGVIDAVNEFGLETVSQFNVVQTSLEQVGRDITKGVGEAAELAFGKVLEGLEAEESLIKSIGKGIKFGAAEALKGLGKKWFAEGVATTGEALIATFTPGLQGLAPGLFAAAGTKFAAAALAGASGAILSRTGDAQGGGRDTRTAARESSNTGFGAQESGNFKELSQAQFSINAGMIVFPADRRGMAAYGRFNKKAEKVANGR